LGVNRAVQEPIARPVPTVILALSATFADARALRLCNGERRRFQPCKRPPLVAAFAAISEMK
jgi:hypothetical protein